MSRAHEEIERKWLVTGDVSSILEKASAKTNIQQAYVLIENGRGVCRVRVMTLFDGMEKAFLCVKGKRQGIVTPEFEYEIESSAAKTMIAKMGTGRHIFKTRHIINFENQIFEVDEFHNQHQGLVLAELELATKDQEVFVPLWIGKEVTDDIRYSNTWLSENGLPKDC